MGKEVATGQGSGEIGGEWGKEAVVPGEGGKWGKGEVSLGEGGKWRRITSSGSLGDRISVLSAINLMSRDV